MRPKTRHLPIALALLCLLALGCSAPEPPAQEAAEKPAPDLAALWASCVEDPTRLWDCCPHIRLSRTDPGLAARVEALQAAHPGHWAATYNGAYFHHATGEFALAREGYEAAAGLARAAGDPFGVGTSLYAAASLVAQADEDEQSVRLLERASVAARAAGDPELQTRILRRMANIHREAGRYWDERPPRLELLSLAEADRSDQAYRHAVYNLAENSRVLGLHDEATRGFERVLRLARQAGDSEFAARAEMTLGILALDARDGRALRLFESATATARGAGNETLEVYGEMLIGVALTRAGRYEEARERLLANLPRARERGGYERLGTLVYLADAERLSGHEESALERYRKILELATDVNEPEMERDALMGLAALQRSRGDADAAIETARRAEAMVESSRSNIAASSERTHFLQLRSNTYQLLAALLAQREPSDLAEPFAVLERAHARALREVLAGRSGAGEAAGAAAETLDLKAVQARLAPGDLLLEFLLGDEESSLLAIDAEGASFHALPPQTRIEAAVRAYRELLQRPASVWSARPSFRRFAGQGHELFDLLLGPVAGQVAAAGRLIVVPDRQLHLLPFEALLPEAPRAGEPLGFLGVSHAIEYLPAAALLGQGAGAGRGIDRVVVVAATRGRADLQLPALKNADEEVRAVVGAYPEGRAVVLDEDAASLRGLIDAAASPIDLLHLIAHAGMDEASGPRVLLHGSEEAGAWLDMETLARLEHAPRLAILSACDTARGELVGGEGILGLVRAFTLAGSRQVVASLWKVDDARTSVMMGRLHQELRAGTPPSEAMRYARAEMLAAGYEHPFHWAGLVLYGPD